MTPPDLTDDIERLRALHSLIVELTPAPAPAPDPIAQLRDVLAIAKDLAPAPAPAVEVTEGSAPLPADAPAVALVVDRVVGVLEKILDRQAAAGAGVSAPAISADEPTPVQVPSWLAPFLGYLPQLIAMADAGQAPELVDLKAYPLGGLAGGVRRRRARLGQFEQRRRGRQAGDTD